jgi:secondary thiamine-phosphate synthase enzyme
VKKILIFGHIRDFTYQKKMKIITEHIHVSTKGGSSLTDLTERIASVLAESGMKEGQALVFAPGATAGVTTIEFEPGLMRDFPDALERIAPADFPYQHDNTWGDGNGHGHVRASMIGPSLTVPFQSGRLLLGTWQQIVLVDCDNRPRKRDVVVQLTGE